MNSRSSTAFYFSKRLGRSTFCKHSHHFFCSDVPFPIRFVGEKSRTIFLRLLVRGKSSFHPERIFHRLIRRLNCVHTSSLRFWSQSMSLHMDIKITRMRAAQHPHFVEKLSRCVSDVKILHPNTIVPPRELTTVWGRDEGSISFASPTFLLVVDAVDIFRRDTQNV